MTVTDVVSHGEGQESKKSEEKKSAHSHLVVEGNGDFISTEYSYDRGWNGRGTLKIVQNVPDLQSSVLK